MNLAVPLTRLAVWEDMTPIQPPRLQLKLLYLHIADPILTRKVFRLLPRVVEMLLGEGIFLKTV